LTKRPFKPGFKNLDRDIDRYLDKFGEWDRSGMTPMVRGYDEAVRTVFDLYVENKAYDAIVDYLINSWSYEQGLNDYFLEASDHLKRDQQVNRLKRLWWAVLAAQRQFLLELRAHGKTVDVGKSADEAKELALGSMARFRDILVELGDDEELGRIDGEIENLRSEIRRRASMAASSEKMDEELFWQLIEQARESSASIAEQISTITSGLEAFRGPQIKNFHKLLEQRLAEAYRWDIWALAYLAQDGCSDDAFEGFRAWLVLQGRSLFERALANIDDVLDDVPPGTGTSGEGLLMAAPIAFEARTGKVMKFPPQRARGLTGVSWEEDDLARRFPEAARHYDGLRSSREET
jgi:hypothetical protein